MGVAEIIDQLADERDFLAATAASMDWRWSMRSVVEARRDCLDHVLVLLERVTP